MILVETDPDRILNANLRTYRMEAAAQKKKMAGCHNGLSEVYCGVSKVR